MAKIIFANLLREWWERYLSQGNEKYARHSWRRLEVEVLPELGDKNPKKITPPMILKILRRVESRGTPVAARKLKCHISQAMRYGIACGYVISDPTRDLGLALLPVRENPHPTLVDPADIGKLMLKIDAYRYRQRRLALKLAVLTFVRAGEIMGASWNEINFNDRIWQIPAWRMKMKKPHLVPLARQSLQVLAELRKISGQDDLLFPSRWDHTKPEGSRVLTYALRVMGYTKKEICAHGFRAMAATVLSDQGFASDVIERQLAHVDKNRVRAAYQRSELLGERTRMMQAWADWLDLHHARAVLEKYKK